MEAGEIWKDIVGFEGYYQISNYGRLKSFKKIKSGRILSNVNNLGWYFNVVLRKKGIKTMKSVKIHRLVAEHFIPNPDGKKYINHKDGNKQNNHVSNLEWCTQAENVKHAIGQNPNILRGMRKYNQEIRPIPIVQFNLDGSLVDFYRNGSDASRATGICQRNILQVASKAEYKPGKTRRQAGGFIWEFIHQL